MFDHSAARSIRSSFFGAPANRRGELIRSTGKFLTMAAGSALLALAIVRPAGAASVFVNASASGVPNVVDRSATSASAANVGTPGQTSSQATAFFNAAGPHLRVFATSDLDRAGGNAAQGLANFSDELIINSPSRTGQAGFYSALFRVSGGMSQHGNAQSQAADRATSIATITVDVAGTESAHGYQEQLTGDGRGAIPTGTNFLNTDITALGRIVFGRPFTISGEMTARTGVVIGTDGARMDATSDLSHSFVWLGYAITDELGNRVTDFELVSQSGSIYAGVPEPAGATLVAMLLLGVPARRHRRRF